MNTAVPTGLLEPLAGLDPVVLLLVGLVVLVLAGLLLRTASRDPGRRPVRPPVRTRAQVGEIWWADVPFEDGTGSKDRPCLVVETHGLRVAVLYITSTDKSGRPGWLPVPRQGWTSGGGTSWLRTDRRVPLDPHRLRRYAGPCPASVRKALAL